MKGWKGDRKEHSLARKGIKTRYHHESGKFKYLGTGRSMHGYMDRSYDTYLFKDLDDMSDIEVVVFTEPDFESIGEQLMMGDINEFEAKRQESDFYNEGEVHVIWAGALDFTGTEIEFKQGYPEMYNEIFG